MIGLKQVEAKLLAAAPRILAHNRAMIVTMLEYVQAEVEPQMPLGPAHFGYHARDSYSIHVKSGRTRSWGVLKGAVQAYWREFGTLGRFRKGRTSLPSAGNARAALYAVTVGSGGESPRPITHKALAGVKKFITFYYGGMAKWWGLP